MSFFFPTLSSASAAAPTGATTPSSPKTSVEEEGRAFPSVSRAKWNKKIVYNPEKPFLSQMEENKDAPASTSVTKYTKLVIRNLVFSFYTDTKFPLVNSDYTLTVYMNNDSKQLTFGPLGKINSYRVTFDDADAVEQFLKDVHSKDEISMDEFDEAKKEADEKLKESDAKMMDIFGSIMGSAPPRRSSGYY